MDLTIVLLVTIGSSMLSSTFAVFGSHDSAQTGLAVLYSANFLFHEIVGLVLLVYVLARQGRRLADIGVSIRLRDFPWSILLFMAFSICYTAGSRVIALWAPQEGGATTPELVTMGAAPLVALAGITLVNPIFEEVIVRAYFATELTALLGNRWTAAAVTVLVQSYYHLYQGWRPAAGYGVGFAVFAVYFALSRRVAPVIIAHMFLDGLGFYGLWAEMHKAT